MLQKSIGTIILTIFGIFVKINVLQMVGCVAYKMFGSIKNRRQSLQCKHRMTKADILKTIVSSQKVV